MGKSSNQKCVESIIKTVILWQFNTPGDRRAVIAERAHTDGNDAHNDEVSEQATNTL